MKKELSKAYDDFFGALHKSPFKNVPPQQRKRLILKFVKNQMQHQSETHEAVREELKDVLSLLKEVERKIEEKIKIYEL